MKIKFNALLFPVLLLFISGAANLYWYAKFEARVPIEEAKFAKLQSAMQLVDCQVLNKDVVLSIARGNVENAQNFASVLLSLGLLFIFIGIINLVVITRKRSMG